MIAARRRLLPSIREVDIKFLKRFILLIVVLAAAAAAFGGTAYYYIYRPVEHPKVEVTFGAGTSVREMSVILEKSGVIECARSFRIYVVLMGYATKLRAGDYEFDPGLSPAQVVRKLLKGDFRRYRFTIPEGWTAKEIANYLQGLSFVEGACHSQEACHPREGWDPVRDESFSDEFLKLSKNIDFIKTLNLGWDVSNLEGYLYPSTYEVYKLKEITKLVALMEGEFRKKFSALILEKSGALGLKPAEVVTLASIVERETGKADERPLIASVFYNRLKKGMPLQSDPTIIYGLKDFDGNLRKSDMTNPHPYNTYVHPGLPPGPICNPGEVSIMAVLNPAQTNYIYFVSKNDGSHQFSEDYNEHLKAVARYQLRRGE